MTQEKKIRGKATVQIELHIGWSTQRFETNTGTCAFLNIIFCHIYTLELSEQKMSLWYFLQLQQISTIYRIILVVRPPDFRTIHRRFQ